LLKMVTRAARALDDGAHEMVNDWQTSGLAVRVTQTSAARAVSASCFQGCGYHSSLIVMM
jgi:hypothetical protein